MYFSTEQMCRKFTRLMLYYGVFNLSSIVIALNYAIYCMCTGNWDISTWNLPLNNVFPFDKSFGGWILKWLFQASTFFTYACCMIIPTTYFVCFCRYIVAICKHFEMLFNEIQFDNFGRSQCKENTQIRKKLSGLIDHHVNVLEWVHINWCAI